MPTSASAVKNAHISSRAGRKRKIGLRHPSDQLVQPTPKQQAAEVLSFVAAQRARHGEEIKALGTPRARGTLVGRLLESGQARHSRYSPETLYRAAERYLGQYEAFQAAVASKRPLAVRGGGPATIAVVDPVAEEKRHTAAVNAWTDTCRSLRAVGEPTEKAVDTVVLHAEPDRDVRSLSFYVIHNLPLGLGALCAHYGFEEA
jgi:hypothetical protein